MKFARGGNSEFDLAAVWNTNEFSHTLGRNWTLAHAAGTSPGHATTKRVRNTGGEFWPRFGPHFGQSCGDLLVTRPGLKWAVVM